jgi:hypothetical protein
MKIGLFGKSRADIGIQPWRGTRATWTIQATELLMTLTPVYVNIVVYTTRMSCAAVGWSSAWSMDAWVTWWP